MGIDRLVGRAWLVPGVLGVLLLIVLAYFAGGQGWNQNSRLALTLAIVDHHELSIDRYHEGLLPTGDKSVADGRYYSDKAIGVSVLGVVPYAVVRPVLARIGDEARRVNLAMYWVVVTTVALPAVGAGVLLYLLALRVRGNARDALFAPLAAILATPVWPFSTVLFGHVTAGAALFASFWLLRSVRENPATASAWHTWGAGLLGSFAVVTEYTVAPLVLVIAGYGIFVLLERRPRASARLVAAAFFGAAVPALLLAVYNAASFGSPWTLGYQALATDEFRRIHSQGLLGIGWPSAEALWYLTFHPVRGLFVHAPVLLLALAGLAAMFRDRAWRAEAVVVVVCVAVLLTINAGFPMWWGGWSASPRHLIPVLFLLGAAIAFVRSPWRPLPVLLLTVSFVQAFMLAATTPMLPDTELASFLRSRAAGEWIPVIGYSPIYDGAARLWADGQFAWSVVGSRLGGVASIVPIGGVIVVGAWLLHRLTAASRGAG